VKRHSAQRCLVLVLAVCVYGAADALIKGGHGGARNAVANISAPWLLISFLSAAMIAPRRLSLGALVGMLSTCAALVSYTTVRALRGFHTGGRAGLITDLTSALTNRWFLLGVAGGAVLGAAGSRLALRRQWMALALVVGAALLMEPIARIIWALAKDEPARTLVPSPAVWAIEVAVGSAALVTVLLRNRRQRQCTDASIDGAPQTPV
jgi:Family of unknown function (DUF6518)